MQGENLNSTEIKNGLKVCIDYLAFTITAPMCVNDAIEFMGFNTNLFEEMPKGSDGYRHMRKCPLNGIAVLYDGTEDMGIHVNVTGKGIASLLEAFKETFACETPFGRKGYDLWQETILSRFFKEVLEIGHFTRIDAAIDDIGANYYTPQEVHNCWHNGKIVTKFRSERIIEEYSNPNICSGCTVYFGSRSSDLMLRIYNKKLEQNKKLKPTDEKYIHDEWIRWELEFKGKHSNEIAHQLIACDEHGVGRIVMGILYYYFRIIELDDCNRSRCSIADKWASFVNDIEKLRLCVMHREKTLEDKEIWIDEQVAPSLALLMIVHSGDVHFLNNIAIKAMHRISNADKERLRAYDSNLYKQFFSNVA